MATDDAVRRRVRGHPLFSIGLAAAVAVPALSLRLFGIHADPLVAAIFFGLAVVGAAFMLAWAAEVVQLDISAGLALALLALVAVLPEYAVDFVFTWKAGKDPAKYAPDALANMTGGNQLLIGIGWSLVVLIAAWRIKKLKSRNDPAAMALPSNEVQLSRMHSIEIAFLVLASIYGLTLPIHRTLTIFDSVILIALFIWYLVRVGRAPAEEPHLVGPSATIGALPTTTRRVVVGALFAGAVLIILLSAEPFAESLVDVGHKFAIDDFVLISLVAPLASEAPELLVAGLFAWRLNAETGLGALVSSKVNQWTLLVGSLPIVFAISSSTMHGLPIDAVQREELFVTAAQSVFGVAVLANRSINTKEAFALLGLFMVQLVTKLPPFDPIHATARITVGIIYLALAAIIITRERTAVPRLMKDGLRRPYAELAAD
jgi:cation:H+ antiporter